MQDSLDHNISIVTTPSHRRLIDVGSEAALVNGIAAFVMIALVVAFFYLCCQMWSLHIHFLRLLRSVQTRNFRSSSNDSQRRSSAVSLQFAMADRLPGQNLPVQLIGSTETSGDLGTNRYETPPPRYSLVNCSPPSYSSALLRSLAVFDKPLNLRITVNVGQEKEDDSAVFLTQSESAFWTSASSHLSSLKNTNKRSMHQCNSTNRNDEFSEAKGQSNINTKQERETKAAACNACNPKMEESDQTSIHNSHLSSTRISPEDQMMSKSWMKLVIKGSSDEDCHVVYAERRTDSNRFVANWTMLPGAANVDDRVEVYADGYHVEDIFLELLSADGTCITADRMMYTPSPMFPVTSTHRSSSIPTLASPFTASETAVSRGTGLQLLMPPTSSGGSS